MAATTFEELEITTPPYVDEYRGMIGVYPTMTPIAPVKLPTRYIGSDGKDKFHMKTIYHPGDRLKVIRTEPSKRSPTEVNIVFAHPSDPGSEIVLTPKDMIKKLVVRSPGSDDAPGDTDTSIDSDLDKITPISSELTEEDKAFDERMKEGGLLWL